jgi:hypothetical protein
MRLRLVFVILVLTTGLSLVPRGSAAMDCAECRLQNYGNRAGCHLCIWVPSPGNCDCDMWGMGDACDQCIAYSTCTPSCQGNVRWVQGCTPVDLRIDVKRELAKWLAQKEHSRIPPAKSAT